MTNTMTRPKPPTEKQIAFVRTLLEERRDVPAAEHVRAELNVQRENDTLSSGVVSWAIDTLLAITKPTKPTPSAKIGPSLAITEDGMYRDPDTGRIFKVQVAKQGSGRLYAKELITTRRVFDHGGAEVQASGTMNDATADRILRDDGYEVKYTSTFAYQAGKIYDLKPEWKMALDEAKAYGALYGNCCVCGADLTDEKSVAAGIGPVCAKRFDR